MDPRSVSPGDASTASRPSPCSALRPAPPVSTPPLAPLPERRDTPVSLPPEILVLSRADAEQHVPAPDDLIVSITIALEPPADLRPGAMGVLRLVFDDVTPTTMPEHPPADLRPLTADHVSRLWAFLAANPGARRLVLHCARGTSRSPGVALGLLDAAGRTWPLGADTAHLLERRFAATHNPFVRRMVSLGARGYHVT